MWWVAGAILLLVCVLVAYLMKCSSRWVSLGLGLLWGLLGILRAELLNDENRVCYVVGHGVLSECLSFRQHCLLRYRRFYTGTY